MNIETLNNLSAKILNLLNIETSINNLIKVDAVILTALVVTGVIIILFFIKIFFVKKQEETVLQNIQDKNVSSVVSSNAQPEIQSSQVTQSEIPHVEKLEEVAFPPVSVSQTTEPKAGVPVVEIPTQPLITKSLEQSVPEVTKGTIPPVTSSS